MSEAISSSEKPTETISQAELVTMLELDRFQARWESVLAQHPLWKGQENIYTINGKQYNEIAIEQAIRKEGADFKGKKAEIQTFEAVVNFKEPIECKNPKGETSLTTMREIINQRIRKSFNSAWFKSMLRHFPPATIGIPGTDKTLELVTVTKDKNGHPKIFFYVDKSNETYYRRGDSDELTMVPLPLPAILNGFNQDIKKAATVSEAPEDQPRRVLQVSLRGGLRPFEDGSLIQIKEIND